MLDIGTGTGVLPRCLYSYGAEFTGTDISENQIETAKRLVREADMDIRFMSTGGEDMDFPENSFDVITACQCYFYFNHETLAPMLSCILKPSGPLCDLIYGMAAFLRTGLREKVKRLVLKYNPSWSGCGETRHPIAVRRLMVNILSWKN